MIIQKSKFYIFIVFLLYIFMTYTPGLILYPFFQERFHSYFSYHGDASESFFAIFITFIFVFTVIFYFLDRVPRFRFNVLPVKVVNIIFLLLAILFFISSVYFYKNYNISFRHKNRLSDAGFIVIFMFFVKYVVLVYTYLCMCTQLKGYELSKFNKFLLWVMLFSWVLSINSSMQIVYVFLVLIMLLTPKVLIKTNNFLGLRGIAYSIAGISCVALILVVGIGNKVGMDFLFSAEGFKFLGGYAATVAARGSTSLYSLASAYDRFFFNQEISFELIYSELFTFLNRLTLYFPFGNFNSEAIDTVSRFNYLLSFANHAERAGGTPGFLASVVLAGALPFGFIGMSIYLFLIVRIMSRPLSGIEHINPVALLFFVYFLLPFMENPLSVVNLLNPASFYLISFFTLTHICSGNFSEKKL